MIEKKDYYEISVFLKQTITDVKTVCGLVYNYDYYAGVDYTVDVSKPVGQRITELRYQGRPVADSDKFTICLNSYRASGAGGYACYTDCPVLREINTEMSDLILEFFKSSPTLSLERRSSYVVIK